MTPSQHFVIKPLSNFDLMDWLAKLGIKHLRGIYSRDGLPHKIRKECGIINLYDMEGAGTHWVCYKLAYVAGVKRGKGRGNLGARGRKEGNACKKTIIFSIFHAQILSVKIVIG